MTLLLLLLWSDCPTTNSATTNDISTNNVLFDWWISSVLSPPSKPKLVQSISDDVWCDICSPLFAPAQRSKRSQTLRIPITLYTKLMSVQ
jgi:hypothetical protein